MRVYNKDMIKYETTIDYKATKDLIKGYITFYRIFILIGILLLATYILLGIFVNAFATVWNVLILIVSIVLIFFGVTYSFLMTRTLKRSNNNILMKYEFHDDYLIAISIKDDVISKPNKIFYKDIKYYRETSSYYFLYLSISNAFPLIKKPEVNKIVELIDLTKIKKKFM